MVIFLLIVVIVAIAGVGAFAVNQKKRTDELERKLAQKKDDIAPYLELLGNIPAENWNDFMRNPVEVARALGLVVEQRAMARYNDQLVVQLLEAARAARKQEIYFAHHLGHDDSAAQQHRTVAREYESRAREIDQQNRLTR